MILPPENELLPDKDYCLICGEARSAPKDRGVGTSSIQWHIENAHKDESRAEEGVNWASSWQIGILRERQDAEVRRFLLNLSSCRGADDFLLEAGGA